MPRTDTLAVVGLLALALAAAGCPGHHEDPLRPPLQGVAPDFSLTDVNPNSATHGQAVSPREYLGKVSAWYFGHATWAYCRSQFGFLNTMQADVDTVATGHAIRLLGVNAAGQESDNALMCQGRSLPWLQDTPQANVWALWSANWRDVVILDGENKVVAVYNLTSHDLSVSANYNELRTMLLNAAGPAAPHLPP